MRIVKLVSLLIFIIISFPAYADEKIPFNIERSEIVKFKSEKLDRTYSLFIQTPRGFHSQQNGPFPVLILTDGAYSFPLACSIAKQLVGLGKIQDLLIVGISYSLEDSWAVSRTRDYTPTYAPEEPNYHSLEARKHSGKANDYLEFISNEVLPFLQENYQADLSRKMYAGHSFGGLFGGYILKTVPSAFNHYTISDPSLWYDGNAILFFEQKTIDENSTPIKIVIVSANPEPDIPDTTRFQMIPNAVRLGEELKADLGAKAEVKHLILEGEIHESLFPVALTRGLRDFLSK